MCVRGQSWGLNQVCWAQTPVLDCVVEDLIGWGAGIHLWEPPTQSQGRFGCLLQTLRPSIMMKPAC